MQNHLLDQLNLPSFEQMSRSELLYLLSQEEYGFSPAAPEKFSCVRLKSASAFAGKAIQSRMLICFETPCGGFSFPFTLILPQGNTRYPLFLNINFHPDIPDIYLPAEEIIDHGYGIANLYYQDVTSDSPNQDGLAALYPKDEMTGWGKLGMWAFAASRIMDALVQRDDIDISRICVCGHSRLGKTALWCAAQDTRFSMAHSNDSGCSGAALSRGKIGESIEDITRVFPYWFCRNYIRHAHHEFEAPFDQHMLLSLLAPRPLSVSSAAEDTWADPRSEYLSCVAAASAWEAFGMSAMPDMPVQPPLNIPLSKGRISYLLRDGEHYFSRTDWLNLIAFREKVGA